MMRGCPATGRLCHIFDKVTHRCACGRWERGFKPKRASDATRDECQVCEGHFALHNAKLVHHGFKRPGIGYIVGDCLGVKRRPFPAWDALEEYRVLIANSLKIHKKLLAELPKATVLTKHEERMKYGADGKPIVQNGKYAREIVEIRVEKPKKPFAPKSGSWSEADHKLDSAWIRWDQQLKVETDKLTREIKALEKEVARVVARIEKAKSLGGVGTPATEIVKRW